MYKTDGGPHVCCSRAQREGPRQAARRPPTALPPSPRPTAKRRPRPRGPGVAAGRSRPPALTCRPRYKLHTLHSLTLRHAAFFHDFYFDRHFLLCTLEFCSAVNYSLPRTLIYALCLYLTRL
jgi:hypothetical protein